MPGARCTRGSCAKCTSKCAHEQTGSAEAIRHSLHATVLRLMPRSPRRTNSSCHRRCRLDGESDPVGSMPPPTAWHQQRVSRTTGFCRTLWRRSSCARREPLTSLIPPCDHRARRRRRVRRDLAQRPRRRATAPLAGKGWGELVVLICPTRPEASIQNGFRRIECRSLVCLTRRERRKFLRGAAETENGFLLASGRTEYLLSLVGPGAQAKPVRQD